MAWLALTEGGGINLDQVVRWDPVDEEDEGVAHGQIIKKPTGVKVVSLRFAVGLPLELSQDESRRFLAHVASLGPV
jgi:hypothetical protein